MVVIRDFRQEVVSLCSTRGGRGEGIWQPITISGPSSPEGGPRAKARAPGESQALGWANKKRQNSSFRETERQNVEEEQGGTAVCGPGIQGKVCNRNTSKAETW